MEAVGDRLAVGSEFLAGGVADDVEALEADEQRLAGFLQDVFDVRVGRSGGGGDCVAPDSVKICTPSPVSQFQILSYSAFQLLPNIPARRMIAETIMNRHRPNLEIQGPRT